MAGNQYDFGTDQGMTPAVAPSCHALLGTGGRGFIGWSKPENQGEET